MTRFPSLQDLGATAEVLKAFAPFFERGLILGRICQSIRDEYRILAEDTELHAEAAGILFHLAERASDLPAVGDWVAARTAGDGEAIVEAVLPRRTCFSRRAAGKREDEQVIAANVDTVFVVCGLDNDFNPRRVERYLTLAFEGRAEPVIVLNKADLCDDVGSAVATVRAIAPEQPIVAISARSAVGIEPLLAWLGPGRTVALLGSSGAGKSTLVNQLLGMDRQRISEVRESDSRGRHTTTHRELIRLPQGGALIDNPGMRELQLWASEESLEGVFGEIGAVARGCRFNDCTHGSEPGCAVQAAIEGGEIPADRWASYLKLRAEIRYHEVATDRNAAAAQKQKWKAIHKAQKQFYKHNR